MKFKMELESLLSYKQVVLTIFTDDPVEEDFTTAYDFVKNRVYVEDISTKDIEPYRDMKLSSSLLLKGLLETGH